MQVEGWGSDVRSLLGRVWGDAPSAGTAAPASARSGTGPEVIVPVFTPNRFVFENVGNVYLMRGKNTPSLCYLCAPEHLRACKTLRSSYSYAREQLRQLR